VAAAAVAGGVAIASEALADPSPSPSASASGSAEANPKAGPGRPGGAFKGGPRGPGGALGLGYGPALHGEFVVPKAGGGYQTIDTQQGEVTAVSSTSITVKSADGFSKTYSITDKTLVDAQRDGIGAVKVGDQVTIAATVDGGQATATDIADITQFRAAHPRPSPSK
jgi:hypothetical protein